MNGKSKKPISFATGKGRYPMGGPILTPAEHARLCEKTKAQERRIIQRCYFKGTDFARGPDYKGRTP